MRLIGHVWLLPALALLLALIPAVAVFLSGKEFRLGEGQLPLMGPMISTQALPVGSLTER